MENDLRIVLTEQPDLVLTMDDGFIGSAYSPQIGVEDIEGGHRVTVTYRDAEQGITSKTFDVLDGEIGPKGDDGYSPTVSITDTADGHVVTITDATGAHTYTVPTYASEEAARQSAEDARSRAEGARVRAEDQRSENERQRVAEWATMQQEIESATEGAESVYATVTKSGDTATISVTDRTGTIHTATVSDGTDGTSPTARVERVEGGAEVTVTDASGTTTAMLYDATIEAGSVTDTMLAPDGIKAQVASMWGNRLTGSMSGEVLTASDAYAAPPLAVEVGGSSVQDGTPTPDAPVPILSVDDLSLVCAGKNLLDPSTLEQGSIYYISGIERVSTTRCRTSNHIPVSPGDSLVLTASSLLGQVQWYAVWYFMSNAAGIGVAFINAGQALTVPSGVDTCRIILRVSDDSNVIPSDFTNIQLELGSTATAYEPYQATTVTLPVTLRSLPDGTRDSATLTYLRPSSREGWAWYGGEVTQRVHEATFDDSGTWYRNNGTEVSGGTWRFEVDVRTQEQPASTWNTASYAVPAYCDHLEAMSTGSLYSSGADHFGIYLFRLYVRMSGITTLDELKAWLASNPLTIQYPVEPTTTALDPIELPVLPAPSVTIYATADATPTLQVTYERDVNITIAALEAAFADLATS